MDNNLNLGSAKEELSSDLQNLVGTVRAIAENCQQDHRALLSLLRVMEASHREICDGLFLASLPTNRHDLYSLLRDIELAGGWPYIPRMKLQDFLQQPPDAEIDEPEMQPPS